MDCREYKKTALTASKNYASFFDVHGRTAWGMLLKAEAAYTSQPAKYPCKLIGIRVVAWLLYDLRNHSSVFGPKAYVHLYKRILDANKAGEPENEMYESLAELGLMQRNIIMSAFRSNAVPIPSSSPNSTCSSLDTYLSNVKKMSELNIEHALHGANGDMPDTAKVAKYNALARDGFRCIVTGCYDVASVEKYTEIMALYDAQGPPPGQSVTNVCHLISAAYADQEDLATVHAFFEMYGCTELVEKYNKEGIHRFGNIMTMTASLNDAFDRFEFWFEEVDSMVNTYDIVFRSKYGSHRMEFASRPRRVTFVISPLLAAIAPSDVYDNKILPDLPDPRLLALRASVARVANLSGAAEQEDNIERNEREMSVLAEDGADAEVLRSLLCRPGRILNPQ